MIFHLKKKNVYPKHSGLEYSGITAFPEFTYLNSKRTPGMGWRCYCCQSTLGPRVHTTGYVPRGCCDVTLFVPEPQSVDQSLVTHSPACISDDATTAFGLLGKECLLPSLAPFCPPSPALLPFVRQRRSLHSQLRPHATTLGVHQTLMEPEGRSSCANISQMCLL